MTLAVREASGMTGIGGISAREASGLSVIGSMSVRDASNTLVEIFGSFSLSAAPPHVFGYTSSHAPVPISTPSTTVTPNPSGAVDSVSWSAVDPDWLAINSTSLTTGFRYIGGVGPGESQSTTFTCTVTRGASTATVDVTAFVQNIGTA